MRRARARVLAIHTESAPGVLPCAPGDLGHGCDRQGFAGGRDGSGLARGPRRRRGRRRHRRSRTAVRWSRSGQVGRSSPAFKIGHGSDKSCWTPPPISFPVSSKCQMLCGITALGATSSEVTPQPEIRRTPQRPKPASRPPRFAAYATASARLLGHGSYLQRLSRLTRPRSEVLIPRRVTGDERLLRFALDGGVAIACAHSQRQHEPTDRPSHGARSCASLCRRSPRLSALSPRICQV